MMSKRVFIIAFVLVLFTCSLCISYGEGEDSVKARITDVEEKILDDGTKVQVIKLYILEGEYLGKYGRVMHIPISHSEKTKKYYKGDKVFIRINIEGDKVDITIIDNVRFSHLISLCIILLILVIVFGGFKGISSLLSLGIAGVCLIYGVIPLIVRGYDPVGVTILISAVIILLSFILISGFTQKSLVAILGTIGGTVVAGILAKVYTELTAISGYSGEEITFLIRYMDVDINFTGLFLSGIIIGSIGVVMDVSMSITSFIFELKEHSPNISSSNMFSSGLKVGRDVMATMINTLVLAYVGSSMPLLLIFYFMKMPLPQLLNMEAISMEIIRSICGSIGLILTIPLTAYIATLMCARSQKTAYVKYKR